MRQAQRSPGFLAGALARDPQGGFWTMTTWTDEAAMRTYRNAGPHMKSMPKLARWCDEAAIAHWEQESPGLPKGEEALARMQAQGRVAKLRHPSPAHTAKQTAPAAGAPQILRRFTPTVRSAV